MKQQQSIFSKIAEASKAKRTQLDENTAAKKAKRIKEEESQLPRRPKDPGRRPLV